MTCRRPASSVFVLLSVTLAFTGCRPDGAPKCSGEEARACAKVLEQGEATFEGEKTYFIRVQNTCTQDIDVKVCFEDTAVGADCQQRMIGAEGTLTYRRPLKFFGDRIKLFVRYTDEARICTFPISTDVRFD